MPQFYNLSAEVPVPLKEDDATFIEYLNDSKIAYQIDCGMHDPVLKSMANQTFRLLLTVEP